MFDDSVAGLTSMNKYQDGCYARPADNTAGFRISLHALYSSGFKSHIIVKRCHFLISHHCVMPVLILALIWHIWHFIHISLVTKCLNILSQYE